MHARSILLPLAGLVLAASQPASAAVITLNLTGNPAGLTTNSFTFGPNTYHTGELVLDPFDPVTIAQGDTLEITLALTGGLTVPGSGEQLFGLNLWQGAYGSPAGSPQTGGTLTFSYSMGPTGLPSNIQGGGCGNCLTAIGGQVPGAAFTFDGLSVMQTIDVLDDPFTIDNATFTYQLRDVATAAVPEPSTWAMMMLGMFAIGCSMRRKRRQPARLRLAF